MIVHKCQGIQHDHIQKHVYRSIFIKMKKKKTLVRLSGERSKLGSSDGIFAKQRACVCLHTCVQGCAVHISTYGHTDHNQQEHPRSGILSDFDFYHGYLLRMQ